MDTGDMGVRLRLKGVLAVSISRVCLDSYRALCDRRWGFNKTPSYSHSSNNHNDNVIINMIVGNLQRSGWHAIAALGN